MQSETSETFGRLTREGPDTRIVLQVYAAVTIVVGATIATTGVRGIPGMSHEYASIIWITGMAIVAAGCAASGLALNDDPVGRRRALRLFAVGHLLLGLMLWFQWGMYWGDHGLPLLVALTPLLTGVALLAAASTTPHLLTPSTTEQRVRSTYDEHIRQIARREERARLARDLHDAVKQQLFVIQTAAATAQARFDDDRAGAAEALEHVRTAAREATTEMEALLDELQAAPMENTGLVEALKKQCEALALRTGADVRFEGTMPPDGSLRPGAHDAIYRVAQEALANVARHARASRVIVSLRWTATQFYLRVSDNGTGVDPSAATKGMGLANMRARAAEIGGHLHIAPGAPGTEVVLSVRSTHPAVRRAWRTAAMFALIAMSTGVFYALRGPSSDLRSALLWLASCGVWVPISFADAYLRAWKDRKR